MAIGAKPCEMNAMPTIAPFSWPRVLAALLGLTLCLFAIWRLESERAGLTVTPIWIGSTPATVYRPSAAASAPAVIIAHGFAGSQQFMQAYALTLAHAGYVVVTFDFLGHGRNPVPLSGDLTHVEGATQRLMRQVGDVTDAVADMAGVDGRIALLGHSMASDIIVRRAITDPRISATIAISMFSPAVTATKPQNLLMISGQWESSLRQEALRNARLALSAASEGMTIGDPAENTGRRTVVAPRTEHVSVLYSPAAMQESRDWLDKVFHRTSSSPVSSTGPAILLLLSGLFILAWPLAALLPRGKAPPEIVPQRTFLVALALPAIMTPLLLWIFQPRFLPVLIADYLAVHFLVYGSITLLVLRRSRILPGIRGWLPALTVAAYGILAFGGAIDRYVTSFLPGVERLPVIALIAMGTLPYMMSDMLLAEGGRAPVWRVLLSRTVFLASLAVAVALNPDRLLFLLLVIPLIIVFFITFGVMGGWIGRRTLSPTIPGIGLGIILAWSLGVTFPMVLSP